MARPTKLTPEVQKRIVVSIRAGATYRLAAQSGGISYETFNEWLKAGESGNKKFSEFSDAVRSAEVLGVLENLQAIKNARHKDWRAASWLLERRHPEDYGKQSTVRVEGNPDKPLTISTITAVLPAGIDDNDTDPLTA